MKKKTKAKAKKKPAPGLSPRSVMKQLDAIKAQLMRIETKLGLDLDEPVDPPTVVALEAGQEPAVKSNLDSISMSTAN